ncbi:MAG: hypothetical protein ACI8W7_000066 [Gammaproteobacteria bacterium]|jgi:hypothetical protein
MVTIDDEFEPGAVLVLILIGKFTKRDLYCGMTGDGFWACPITRLEGLSAVLPDA